MTDRFSAASVGTWADESDDEGYVPQALRPVRARGALAVFVILFTAAIVATAVLPVFGR